MRRLAFGLALLATVPAASVAAQPADSASGLGAGAMLPRADERLDMVGGGGHSLGGEMGPNGLVVAFWSAVCPWAERNTGRMAALVRDYGPAGIGFIAVDASDPAVSAPGDDPRLRVAEETGLMYVLDPGGSLARTFGVSSAPTVFFFDADGRLVYEGAIDDSPADADAVDVPYLRQAMDQHLAGMPVEIQRTAALGCTIRGRR